MVCDAAAATTMAEVAEVTMTVRITELSLAAGQSAAELEGMEFDHGRWKLQGRLEKLEDGAFPIVELLGGRTSLTYESPRRWQSLGRRMPSLEQ